MDREAARRLLDQIGIIRHPCDLDLLLFFMRHRRALLTTEHLASLLGYEAKRIAESLDALLAAGLLEQTQTPAHAAHLYILIPGGPDSGWLPTLLNLGSSRDGRLALIEALPRLQSDP